MKKSKLISIGFEIEGEWDNNIREKIRRKYNCGWHNDGTIEYCSDLNINPHCNSENYIKKELNSPIYLLNTPQTKKQSLIAIKKLFNAINKKATIHNRTYPIYHFNRSCGFHIHLGFNPIQADVIFSVNFYKYFINAYKQKYKKDYYQRYLNKYCFDFVNNNIIVNGAEYNHLTAKKAVKRFKTKQLCVKTLINYIQTRDRYRSINFFHSLLKHGTVEIRIFKASTPKKMLKVLLFTIKTVEDFLKFDFTCSQNLKLSYKNKLTEHTRYYGDFGHKHTHTHTHKINITLTHPIKIKTKETI